MAIASFFDRAALAAWQVLEGADYAALTTELTQVTVGVGFDDRAAASPEGRVTLELAVNLLARLYPRLALVGRGRRAQRLEAELADQARAINPVIDLSDDLNDAAAVLGVGRTPIITQAPVVYLGSSGWVARLSTATPLGSGRTINPFGAAAAACFGAANVFRLLFARYLPHGAPDAAFTLSLLDLQPNAPRPENPALRPIDIGRSVLVGLGAIGNAAVWALARTPGVSGQLDLVDHEAIDLSNLQRYLLTTQESVGAVKVQLAAQALAATGLQVGAYQARWGAYLRGRDDWHLPRVAVALDSADDRRAVQAALPGWIVNAWTQPADLGVSRHRFLSEDACLTCLYYPDESPRSEEQLVAEALGLPAAQKEVGRLLDSGQPIGPEWLGRIAETLGVPIEPLLPFTTQPLRTFYSRAICGGLVFQLGAGANTQPLAVPLAFQSALAGILLAAELLAEAGHLRAVPPATSTRFDLLRPLPAQISRRAGKLAAGRCICQDPVYVEQYRRKYERDVRPVAVGAKD